jgi:hypothetical protein
MRDSVSVLVLFLRTSEKKKTGAVLFVLCRVYFPASPRIQSIEEIALKRGDRENGTNLVIRHQPLLPSFVFLHHPSLSLSLSLSLDLSSG